MEFVPAATPALKARKSAKNEKFANDGSYASVQAQLHQLAMKCYARVQAMGLGMDFDDVLQEMNLSYVRAHKTWDPAKGVRFSTYCQRACLNNFNQRIERQVNERANLGMVSVEDMMGRGGEEGGDGDSYEYLLGQCHHLGDGMGDVVESAEDQLGRLQEARARLARLTNGSKRLVLALLMDERDKENLAGAKLRDLAEKIGLRGEELKHTKREIRAVFGVVWN